MKYISIKACLLLWRFLWVALWGSGTVGKFDPATGQLLQKVMVPAPNVSSCAFGGKDLETLYITTARAWVFLPAWQLSIHSNNEHPTTSCLLFAPSTKQR